MKKTRITISLPEGGKHIINCQVSIPQSVAKDIVIDLYGKNPETGNSYYFKYETI